MGAIAPHLKAHKQWALSSDGIEGRLMRVTQTSSASIAETLF
jgi:hypothetical protein